MIGTPFLKLVAKDLYEKYDGDFSKIVIVFPNNRARLFFDEYLLDVANKPVWYPCYTTIKDLFQSQSDLQVADSIKLVCLLYQAYKQVCEKEHEQVETLDSFYHWGEVLLADFEDVDSNLVEAEQLFQNIKDLASYESLPDEYLTEEQKNSIRLFFHNFNAEKTTALKEKFLLLWRTLLPTYQLFREMLLKEHIAYEGMLKRSVVEDMKKNGTAKMTGEKYVFVGFNVLNKCERELFHRLHTAKKALFYWDVDDYYMKEQMKGKRNEAAIFMSLNLADFPNELEDAFRVSAFEQKDRTFTIVSASTESAQAKYVEQFLQDCRKKDDYQDEQTAVVLCREPLLLSVLHSIPNKVNVTMGLPIVQTPIYGMIQLLLEYQDLLYYYTNEKKRLDSLSLSAHLIVPLLRNHFLRKAIPSICELDQRVIKDKQRFFKLKELKEFSVLFRPAVTPNELLEWLVEILLLVADYFRNCKTADDLYKESLYRAYTLLQRLSSLQSEKVLDISYPLLTSLIDRMLTSTSVPFTGDELKGVQVMGFLETRNLDFSNVILLSANEGTLPNSGKESSFIPYNLRKGFGMTTVEHKNALYAYYFYRLLQRAENVTFMYNISTEGSSKGQMSRFLMQLLVESGFAIERKNVSGMVTPADTEPISVEKTAEVMDRLKKKYDLSSGGERAFSPTSFISFVKCPLSFYFSYVLGLKKQDELEEEVQASEFGSIFHASMQYFYEDVILQGRPQHLINPAEFPDDPRKTTDGVFVSQLNRCVEKAFRNVYFLLKDSKDPMPELSGDQLLNRDAVIRHMRRMLSIDREYAPFHVVSMENEYECTFSVDCDGSSQVSVRLKGTIDRVDEKEGVVRILDYKTGGSPSKLYSIERLFDPNTDNHYALQVFLYSLLYAKKQTETVPLLRPAIAYLTSCEKLTDLDLKGAKDSIFPETIAATNEYLGELEETFVSHIKRLFDPSVPFHANKSPKTCKYCDFKSLCGVKETSY